MSSHYKMISSIKDEQLQIISKIISLSRGNYLSSASSNDINPLHINIMVNIDITIYQYSTSTIEPWLPSMPPLSPDKRSFLHHPP